MTHKQGQLHDCRKFGEDFEVDLRAYQLRRAGRVLKLEPTPMELLLFLVEHCGELVTRDQIVERIWGKDVFLDTDNSINGAIRKIRQVLKDDPEQPRFVETVSGKGYRFIAPVAEPETPDFAHAHGPTGTPRGKHLLAVAATAVGILAVATLAYFYLHRKPKLTDKDTIVVADFANTTGDPVFDGTLRQGLAAQLEQSPFLSLISEERIKHTLSLMGQPVDTPLTPEVAHEICERTGSAAVLDGSITSLGARYVLGLRARSCPTGDILDQEQAQAARKEDVLNALGQIASRFRSHVGESLVTIQKYDTPLAEATTSSLEALKAYSAAWKMQASSGSAGVIPLLKRAIEIDPNFALGYAALGRMYDDIGESDLAAESTSKAYELRGRVSDRERFFIGASYDLEVTGNMEKAHQTCEVWAQTYPRDPMPHAFLSGIVYPVTANYQEAVLEAHKVIALDPSFVVGYWNLAYAYQYLGQLGDAENTLRQAAERKLDIPDFWVQRYDIAFLKRDAARMEAAALHEGKPGAEEWLSYHQALVLAYSGQLQQARRMAQHAKDLALQAGQREEASLFEAAAALREGFLGNATEARHRATEALALSNNRDTEYGAAFAFALAGENTRSKALADELEKRYPEDTSVKFSYSPSIRGLLALRQGKAAQALNLLAAADPYELCAPDSSFHGFFGALYPIYVRGETYFARKEGVKAAAEFQKILDHSGIVVSDPVGALAHLGLARAYALQSQSLQGSDADAARSKARAAYQDFLTLWKDADPGIPILIAAKSEYAKLATH
jgi:eukaryotic-like serine/threonine-protein kinase